MKRLLILALTIMIILQTITGCWSRRELTDLAIASAIGIDKADNGYSISVQVINPGLVAKGGEQGGGQADTPVTVYSEQGKTLFETSRKLTRQLPRKIYFAHLRVVVFGEEVAKEGVRRSLDFLVRDHEMRSDFFMVVARETTAHQILTTLTPLEKIPANKMFLALETSNENWAATGKVRLDQMISDLIDPGKAVVLSSIRIRGEPEKRSTPDNTMRVDPNAVLTYEGLAVFKEDRLIGWLNEDESKGYNYTIGDVTSTVILLNGICKGNKEEDLGIEVIRTKAKMKGQVNRGKPKVELTIKGEANVDEVECYIDLMNNQIIQDIERQMNEKIQKGIEDTVSKVQEEYKVDIFGFGQAIYRADPKYWKEIKNEWDKEFVDLEVNVIADMKIRRIGTIDNPIRSQEE